MLVPEGLKVLGGMVEEMEAEIKKLVEKVKRTRTWYDQRNATATLAWKSIVVDSRASGVGGFAIADYSTSQHAIPFRSFIQDWAMKKMDDALLIRSKIKIVLSHKQF